MDTFEWILLLLVSAPVLAEGARRFGAPYPTLLALGGVGLAFIPHSPGWGLDPDLILLSAFTVVFGTLVLQGLTMKPIIRLLCVKELVDPVSVDVRKAQVDIYRTLLASASRDDSEPARVLAKEYRTVIDLNANAGSSQPLHEVPAGALRRAAIQMAREKVVDLRHQEIIGEQAHRLLVQELDWAELAAGGVAE